MNFNLDAITQWIPLRTLIFLGGGLVIFIIGYLFYEFWFKKQEGGLLGNDYIEASHIVLGFVCITVGMAIMYLYTKGIMMVYLPYLLGLIAVGSVVWYIYWKYKKYKGERR